MADWSLELAPWADLVFHVLAHVQGSAALASSAYDPRYVAFVERRLGPARERSLAEDTRLLAELAPTHEALARLQLLAWLFGDLERPRALAGRGLGELEATDVDDPSVLRAVGPVGELLWCACLLELPAFERLGAVQVDREPLVSGFERARAWAPQLARCRIGLVRSLCRRGRIRDARLWVGAPNEELGVSVEHVCWQASHEATVGELGRRNHELGERRIEHAAVVLLAERARACGAGNEHLRWLSHFGANAPPLDRGSLGAEERALLEQL